MYSWTPSILNYKIFWYLDSCRGSQPPVVSCHCAHGSTRHHQRPSIITQTHSRPPPFDDAIEDVGIIHNNGTNVSLDKLSRFHNCFIYITSILSSYLYKVGLRLSRNLEATTHNRRTMVHVCFFFLFNLGTYTTCSNRGTLFVTMTYATKPTRQPIMPSTANTLRTRAMF